MEEAVVSAVTDDTSEAKITVGGVPDRPGVAARLFRQLADRGINIDMIVQNTSAKGITDISFTVAKTDLEAAIHADQAVFGFGIFVSDYGCHGFQLIRLIQDDDAGR